MDQSETIQIRRTASQQRHEYVDANMCSVRCPPQDLGLISVLAEIEMKMATIFLPHPQGDRLVSDHRLAPEQRFAPEQRVVEVMEQDYYALRTPESMSQMEADESCFLSEMEPANLAHADREK